VVEWLRLAAEAREDRRGVAWALHQLGTLALCAGNRAAAQGALTQALRLRESAGDREGARVTRHNLDLLLGVPSGPEDRGGERWRGALRAARKPVVAAAVVAVVGTVGVVSLVSRETAPPVPRAGSAPLAQEFREAPVDSAPRAVLRADSAATDTAVADTTESPRPAPPPPARIRADRTAVDFGSHLVGAPGGERRVGVTNEGGSPARIAGVRLEGGARDFRLAGSGCEGAVLAPGEGCSVSVRFTPAASGRRTATLVLEPGAQGSRLRVGLRGEGEETPPPRRVAGVAVSPAGGVDFGEHEVGAPPRVLRVTLASRGTAPLALRGLSVEGAAARDFTVDAPCEGAEVAPGVACSVAVRFSPTAPGRRTAELLVRSNDPAGPQRVPLGGIGAARVVAAPADARLSAASLELGERPVGAVGDLGGFVDALVNGARILTIRSTGQAPLQVSAVRIEGADAGDFSVGSRPCRSPVPPQQSCRFRVNFNPGATGVRRAVLVVEDNTAASPRRVELSGVGVEPRDRAAPPTPQPRGIGSPDVNQAPTQCRTPLHLSWAPVSDPSAPVTYRVTFLVGPTGGTPGEHFLDTRDTSQTVPALGSGQSLRWNVRARDAAGNESRPSGWLHVVCQSDSVLR
ncbi:MAG TPA: choice-of-anchor D domain-containing protein, partial [Longimicrobiaceae bacterium]